MREFEGNSAHSFGWFGVWVFEQWTPKVGGTCSSREPEVADFRDFTAWNCEKGKDMINYSKSITTQMFQMCLWNHCTYDRVLNHMGAFVQFISNVNLSAFSLENCFLKSSPQSSV